MDFEIEGDDDDYNFDYGDDNKPAVKKSSMFGGAGGYEDESEYNFSYENDRGTKKKYEPFSPQGFQSNAPVSKGKLQNVAVANSGNALERAQSLMDRYSGKTVSAPSSNFRNQNIRTFSEADISLSEDEPSESEFEMSESVDDTPVGKKNITKGGAKGKPVGKRDINALDSKAHVVVSMGDEDDSHSADSDYLSEHDASAVEPPPRSLKHAPTFDDVSQGDEEEQEEDGNEYSNEEFDHDAGESYEESAEEIGESTHLSVTVDTEPEVPNAYGHANKAPLGVQFAVRNGTSANFPSVTATSSNAIVPNQTNVISDAVVSNAVSTANNNATTAATTGATGSSSYYSTSNVKSVFNSERQRPPSPAYSDHTDSTRPVSPDPEEESVDGADKDHSIRSESPNDNNASYSRLVYGNEDEQDSVSEYSGEDNNNINLNGTTGSRGSHGKPKVFSFADLLSQESWDADKLKEAAPTTSTYPITTNTNITNASATGNAASNNATTTNANTVANSMANHLDVSEIQDEFTSRAAVRLRPAISVAPAVIAVGAANRSSVLPVTTERAAVLPEPTRSSSPPTNKTLTKNNTTNNIKSNTATSAAQDISVAPASSNHAAATAHPAQTQLPAQYPAYPYPYPPPPFNTTSYPPASQPPPVDAQGQPLPSPGHAYYPPQYAYPYPPPVPPQYYPYPYPPSPYYPAPYASPYPIPAMSGPGGPPGYPSTQLPPHTAPHTASYPPSYPHLDPRFSHDSGLFNPLLHGTAPALHVLETLTNPRSHNVANRLSLSQSNQLYGSAYFDRDVAQQPLVVDLLQELRKSKEEAQWAKNKLAETIVKLGQQQQLNNSNTNYVPKTSEGSNGGSRSEGPLNEMKMNTPDKVKKHNAVSFLQDVISPVLPVRAPTNVLTNNGGNKGNTVSNQRNNSDDSELDEVPSEDESDNSASDYSDDFEDAASSPTPKNKTNTASTSASAATTRNNSNNDGNTSKPTSATSQDRSNTQNNTTNNAAATTTKDAYKYTGATLAEVKAAQEEASRGIRERERVLNPLKESLAYSLLASQELFKNQLESLRLRISATNDYTNLLQQRANTQWEELNTGTTSKVSPSPQFPPTFDTTDLTGSSFQPTPSLHHLRGSFEARRAASSEKLLDLLTQVYPNMTVEEATRLAAKI